MDDINPFPAPLAKRQNVKRVVICLPLYGIKRDPVTNSWGVFDHVLESLQASLPLLREAGWEVNTRFTYNNPYISNARDELLREALDLKATVIVFIDQDVSWAPRDLLTLIETPGDVVSGTYRFKTDDEDYMGMILPDINGGPQWRENEKPVDPAMYAGPDPSSPDFNLAILAYCIPAGFLKITPQAVSRFMRAYPELCYGPAYSPTVDLFNHGAHGGVWYGEDYAFSRNWRDLGGEILLLPNLNIVHWDKDNNGYAGNYHFYMARRPGGALSNGEVNGNGNETGGSGVQRSAA